MKFITKKNLSWAAATLAAICGAYSLATRFTDILYAPMQTKIAILASTLVVSSLLSTWIFWSILVPLTRDISLKAFIWILALSIAAAIGIFSLAYSSPPFPEDHLFTLTVLEEKNPLSAGNKVEIGVIREIALPADKVKRVPISKLALEGSWQGKYAGYGLVSGDGHGMTACYQRFMQGGLMLEFITGPQGGIAGIDWDGRDSTIDLYAPEPGTAELTLMPAFDWQRADRTRKLLVGAAFATDLACVIVILAATLVILYQVFAKRDFRINKPGLLAACLVLISVLFLIASSYMKPVAFDNPELESAVRAAIKNPEGQIYRHQMLTVASLDASGYAITSLNGIEKLVNLRDLELGNNQITDLAPLASLAHLEKLDLRDNKITDLSPLAGLTGLEKLNIRSNPTITSIHPLKNLANLKTLIMADVPVRDDMGVLAGFTKLKHLNMKNSGVTALDVIGRLNDLEYLNLYSNPEITSIRPVGKLDKLETLILANVPVGDDVFIISQLQNLRYLNLRNAQLNDIAQLAGLSKLRYLNLHSNPNISSIQPLIQMAGLETLVLRNIPVGKDIAIVRNFPELRYLNIRNCGITDVAVLGELMSEGSLQNDAKHNILAGVDIRDNPIPRGDVDAYTTLRAFWENISDRRPVELPFFAALDEPVFSRTAGFYETGFDLELSKNDSGYAPIYFTLDGSEPTLDSPVYSKPIKINNRAGEANRYSAIESIAADWNKPEGEVFKATVVRARVIDEKTGKSSAIATQTYFVGQDTGNRYSLPIISIVTDPFNLFDNEKGIYVLGKGYQEHEDEDLTEDERQAFANFSQRGREWERPVHIELFEAGGQPGFEQDGGMRIHGLGSRRNPQKSLRIYARSEYDLQDYFTYPLFTGQPNEVENAAGLTYQSFILRNSGQDWMKSMIRDSFTQGLVNQSMALDTQGGRMAVAFLNGEYWGVYYLQERYDEYYLANHYSISPDKVAIMRQPGELFRGKPGSDQHYARMLKFIRENDLSDEANYAYIQTQMDVDNYIDYLAAEIYTGNEDWPHANLYFWRKETEQFEPDAPYGQDGRWRWMLFDMDWGFGLRGTEGDYQPDTLKAAQKPGWSGFLFSSLLKNEAFRLKFINRFTDLLNTSFASNRVISILNDTEKKLLPEMDEFFQRWNYRGMNVDQWETEIGRMRIFARNRPDIVRRQLIDQFGLSETATITIIGDSDKGNIRVNSVDIFTDPTDAVTTDSWSGLYFKGLPVTITAIPKPGYRFEGWEGIDQNSATLNVTPGEDINLTARFIKN